MVSASSHLLNEGGAVAFMQLIALDMGVADGCTDPCVCDGNGAVGGTCKLCCVFSHAIVHTYCFLPRKCTCMALTLLHADTNGEIAE